MRLLKKHTMGARFKSSTATVWSLLILLTTITYSSMEENTHKITCDHMKEFNIPLNNEEYYIIHSTEVSLEYNPRVQITTSFGKNQPANIAFNTSIVHFEGYLYKYPDAIIHKQEAQTVNVDIDVNILGIGTLRTLEMREPTIDEIKECRVFSGRTGTNSFEILSAVKNVTEHIIIHAQLCTNKYLCGGSGSVKWKINTHVDMMLTIILDYMKYNSLEIITLSDINRGVFLPLKNKNVSCGFHAWDGYFSQKQHLKRKNDVFLMKKGNIRTVRADLEINIATMQYKNYTAFCEDTVGMGFIKGEINQLSLEILMTIDYSNHRCSVGWDDIIVTNIGNMSVTINGLDLPSSNSDIFELLEFKWHNEVIKLVETALISTANKYVGKYICDKYSPHLH